MREGTPTLCDSMDGNGEYSAKWNKSDSEKINTMWSHLQVEPNEQNKQVGKIEPEAWKQGTASEGPAGSGKGGKGGKKGKGLIKEQA